MPNLKLYYFDLPGRAEAIRIILYMADIPFEDVRIQRSSWPEIKDKMPFKQVPVLEIDGMQLPQSHAILRYVEHLAGLTPKCDLHAAIGDSIVCVIDDFFTNHVSRWIRADADHKIAVGEELANVVLPPLVESIDTYLKPHVRNGFIKGSLSAADVLVYQLFTSLQRGDFPFLPNGLPEFSTKYVALSSIMKSVAQLPKIQEYVARQQAKR